jgi:hypothetical protein
MWHCLQNPGGASNAYSSMDEDYNLCVYTIFYNNRRSPLKHHMLVTGFVHQFRIDSIVIQQGCSFHVSIVQKFVVAKNVQSQKIAQAQKTKIAQAQNENPECMRQGDLP